MTPKLVKVKVKTSAAAARMAGRSSGSVTVRNARAGDAPSICAACVNDGGRFCQ